MTQEKTMIGPGEIVLPGQELGASDGLKAGDGAYRRDGRVYASRLGILDTKEDTVQVMPLAGVYDPKPGDLVIGIVVEHGPSSWFIDINAPYQAPMHVNEVPWEVGFAETSRFLEAGESILCKVLFVDEAKKVQVTMKDRNLRKLTGGVILDVAPSKVPRIIGKGGSMIELVKKHTDVWLFVGQNGRIWMNGEPEGMRVATEAFRKIEKEAHIPGLTDRMKAFLADATGRSVRDEEEE